MMNVGDEKGRILDAALERIPPRRILELGTYCGYSAVRIMRSMPAESHLYSIERNAANAEIARRIWAHVGVADRATVVVGSLGDGGDTLQQLHSEHGFHRGTLDFVFVDHDKAANLSDLQGILERGWLYSGSVVLADNIKFPGAPGYRAYMARHEGKIWRTVEHQAHVAYQSLIKDLMLESEYLGGPASSEPG
jgi:catechol O-methyltransferase